MGSTHATYTDNNISNVRTLYTDIIIIIRTIEIAIEKKNIDAQIAPHDAQQIQREDNQATPTPQRKRTTNADDILKYKKGKNYTMYFLFAFILFLLSLFLVFVRC